MFSADYFDLSADMDFSNEAPKQCNPANWRDEMDPYERYRLVEELFEAMRRKHPSYNPGLLAQETAEIVENSWNLSSSLQDFYARLQSWGEKRSKRPRPVEWTQDFSYGMDEQDDSQDDAMDTQDFLTVAAPKLLRAASSPSVLHNGQQCARESSSRECDTRQTKRIRVALDI